MRPGRPCSVNDEVVAALIKFGVKPGVIALAFGVHPKTIERAKRRHDSEVQPTIARLRAALEHIGRMDCYCKNSGDVDCAICFALGALK